jgi:hypothetical protein
MALFDQAGKVFNTVASSALQLGSQVLPGLGTAAKLAGALNSLGNPAALVSKIRSISLPKGANPAYKSDLAKAAVAEDNKDWRVRLSIPMIDVFTQSPVLLPLIAAGGLIFPFTPTIQLSGNATYDTTNITHNNYSYLNYVHSAASNISISGPFNVEDAIQGEYWLAAVHYLRSVTKMFTGESANAGNPPPMVYLNGYGDYVFKNIPVVITSFQVELPQDVAYIGVTVGTGKPTTGFMGTSGSGGRMIEAAGAKQTGPAGVVGFIGKGVIANAFPSLSNQLSAASNLTGGESIANMDSKSHVPVKSTITVNCQPVYSREKVRKFNLDDFVQGKYLDNKPGFL